MSEMTISGYVLGIIAFVFFIVAGVSMTGILQDSDSTFAQDEKFSKFNQSFNVVSDVTDEVNALESGITDADTDFGTFGVLNSLISSSWQLLRLIRSSFSFMDGVFEGFTEVFGVPGWIPGLAILTVMVIIVFAILGAVFQRRL